MLTIKAMGCLEVQVTKNHPMLVCKAKKISKISIEPSKTRFRTYLSPGEAEFIIANDLNNGDFLVFPKQKKTSNISHILLDKYNQRANKKAKLLPSSIKLDEEFGWLMGIYAAEGSSDLNGSNNTFSFNIKEKEYIDKTQYILNNLFSFNSSVYDSPNVSVSRVFVCSKLLSQFFIESFGRGSYNKHLPNWIFSAPDEFVKGFLKGYNDGDGCVSDGRERYISSSKHLLLDLQRLLAQRDTFSNLCTSRKKGEKCKFIKNGIERECVTKGLFELSVFSNRKKEQFYEDESFFYLPIRSVTKSTYSGDVINFKTSGKGLSDHTFTVGNLVSHNCDGAIWHNQEGRPEKDAERDRKLAAYGWRVLRFNEDAINSQMDEVQKVIEQNIQEAAEERFSKRKKAFNTEDIKLGMVEPEYEPLVEYLENGEGMIQIISGVKLDGTNFPFQLEEHNSGSQKN